jgi:hypothetical protein
MQAAVLLLEMRNYITEDMTAAKRKKLRLEELRKFSEGERHETLVTLLTEQRGFVLHHLNLNQKRDMIFAMDASTLVAILGPLFDARPRLLADLNLPRAQLQQGENPCTVPPILILFFALICHIVVAAAYLGHNGYA